ncbi:MAG: CoA-binding protein [Lautropia sp.]
MVGALDSSSLRRVLGAHRVIAVVGLSADWHRPSFFAAKYMQQHGYRIVPVNPRYDTVLGERCHPSLDAVPSDLAATIGIVDVFRRSEDVMPIARQAIAIGARVLWQQLGVDNEAASRLAIEHGLEVVTNRCVKIEHARLFGGLNWIGVNTGIVSSRRRRA